MTLYSNTLFLSGLDIVELKAAALEHIRCSLTPENVTEICSPFTARFPEVRKIERDYLKANWVCDIFILITPSCETALNWFRVLLAGYLKSNWVRNFFVLLAPPPREAVLNRSFLVGEREEHQVDL